MPAKHRTILHFFSTVATTARTLLTFQDCHFFKAEIKESSSGENKN